MTTLRENIWGMRKMASMLIPHTFPIVPFEHEQDVLVLKQRRITVDGYDTTICFSRADYGEYYLDSLQIQNASSPFLPFNLICKLGRAFLGEENLSYVDFVKDNRKVYCWTLRVRDEKPLPPSKKSEMSSYEGFEYSILAPGAVDLH